MTLTHSAYSRRNNYRWASLCSCCSHLLCLVGLPPVINFAQPALRERIVEDTLSGKKPICLAVTEVFAGSDVQGLRCRATRTQDGWIVNGTKKWITNAMWAHYFTVACKAENGEIVVLVVERGEGVQTRPIKTAYSSSSAGTAFVTFDNVRVPLTNQLGAGQPGLNIIVSFVIQPIQVPLLTVSHFSLPISIMRGTYVEISRGVYSQCYRWVLTAATIAGQRLIFEECFKLVLSIRFAKFCTDVSN
jgi:hypothetical protein